MNECYLFIKSGCVSFRICVCLPHQYSLRPNRSLSGRSGMMECRLQSSHCLASFWAHRPQLTRPSFRRCNYRWPPPKRQFCFYLHSLNYLFLQWLLTSLAQMTPPSQAHSCHCSRPHCTHLPSPFCSRAVTCSWQLLPSRALLYLMALT